MPVGRATCSISAPASSIGRHIRVWDLGADAGQAQPAMRSKTAKITGGTGKRSMPGTRRDESATGRPALLPWHTLHSRGCPHFCAFRGTSVRSVERAKTGGTSPSCGWCTECQKGFMPYPAEKRNKQTAPDETSCFVAATRIDWKWSCATRVHRRESNGEGIDLPRPRGQATVGSGGTKYIGPSNPNYH